MKLIKIGLIACLASGCLQKKPKANVIAFSCIKCSGCVTNNLNYIKQKSLDKSYQIVLDTNCYEQQMEIIRNIQFEQLDNNEIEKKFGGFGNFILIDSLGKKTEFMTDMDLKDYIK